MQIAGAFDELIGVATVFVGIDNTRRSFTDRPGIVEDLKHSLKRVLDKLRGKQQTTTVVGQSIESSFAVGTHTIKTTDDYDELTIEQRVEHLSQRLDSETKSLRDDLTSKGQQLQQAIDAEAHTREQLDDELRGRIGNLAAGGLSMQTFGASAILVGLIVSIIGISLS